MRKNNLHRSRPRDKGTPYAGRGGAYASHVRQVYNDTDFITDISLLRSYLQAKYGNEVSLDISVRDEHIEKSDLPRIRSVASKYRLSLFDLAAYDPNSNSGDLMARSDDEGGLETVITDGYHPLKYIIGPKTTLQQIIDDWPVIKEWREFWYGKANTKNKAPDDPQLIYAIFKAREFSGMTFPLVFRHYQDGELPGYINRPTNQFMSQDSLQRYYRKYIPKKHNPDT